MKSKKGVSTVVATVLLLLLTVTAFIALSQFIVPFVKNGLQGAGECKGYESYLDFEDKIDNGSGIYNYNCYVTTGTDKLIGFSIKGNAEFNDNLDGMSGFFIELTDGDNKAGLKVLDGDNQNNTLGGVKYLEYSTETLSFPRPNDISTYVYNSSKIYSEAKVHAIVKSGRVCDKFNSIKLSSCSGVGLG
jgi:hypothetical protein